jgi:peptide maturation system acyl carrier-related protein
MTGNDIRLKLGEIICRRFGENAGRFLKEADTNLLNKDNGLNAQDMVYLYFDVEKEFNIKIDEKSIIDGRFNTINGITNTIIEKMEGHYSLIE